MKQRGQVTFEMEETIVLHEGAMAEKRFCTGCDSDVLMIVPRAAAALFGLTEREVFRFVESGKIHFTENEPILVCLSSVTVLLNEILSSAADIQIKLLGESL